MSRVRLCAVSVAGALALASCGGNSAEPPRVEPLSGDVARVDDVRIPASLVGDVARARGTSARQAADALIEDALAAHAGRSEGLEHAPEVSWASTAALARIAALRFEADAQRAGPPTDDELATITVMHALVRRSPSLPPARAVQLARALASALAPARDAKDFEARAHSVAGVAEWLRVQDLPGFDIGGDTTDGGHFDPTFVAAAFALHHPGDTSGVVETPFGWHVIRLISREIPPEPLLDERRSRLVDTVTTVRARAFVEAAIEQRLRSEAVEVSPAADALMTLTQQARDTR